MSSAFEICYITDRSTLSPKPLLPRIMEAVRTGIDLIQIREKDLRTRDLVGLVGTAVGFAQGTSTQIVVNDRLDVALAVGAAGVHLGSQSILPQTVRGCVNQNFLVGVSCHSLEEALQAEKSGAHYVLLGPIFPTPSKLRYGPPLGWAALKEATARIRTPILALGGVTIGRVQSCIEAGATGIAGISIFQNCDSMADRVEEIRNAFLP